MIKAHGTVHKKQYSNSSMEKSKLVVICGIFLMVIIFCSFLFSTELKAVGMGGFTSNMEEHILEQDEILFGKETFYKEGLLPIYIESVEIVTTIEQKNMFEMYVFHPLRQNHQLTGGQISYNEFMEDYGDNLSKVDSLNWLKDSVFEIVILGRVDRIENVTIRVTYRVAGILEKTVESEEIII